MQTFVPFPEIQKSAAVLDDKRLGKQRVEAMQILNALACTNEKSRGWKNHPATVMWKGYRSGLVFYTYCMVWQWKFWGFQDSVESFLDGAYHEDLIQAKQFRRRGISWQKLVEDKILPPWFGGPIHSTHRSALLAKDPIHYSQFGWEEIPTIQYFWPVDVSQANNLTHP